MKNLLLIYLLFVIGCRDDLKNTYLSSKESMPELKCDSTRIDSVRIDNAKILYQLKNVCLNGETHLVSEVLNEDYNLEFSLRYRFLGTDHNFECYEVNDLPTGVCWNIFFDRIGKAYYQSEKFDLKAIGDSIDRRTVNFKNLTAKVFSNVDKQIYTIKLIKLKLRN